MGTHTSFYTTPLDALVAVDRFATIRSLAVSIIFLDGFKLRRVRAAGWWGEENFPAHIYCFSTERHGRAPLQNVSTVLPYCVRDSILYYHPCAESGTIREDMGESPCHLIEFGTFRVA